MNTIRNVAAGLYALGLTLGVSTAQTCQEPARYCSTSPNSVGAGALISYLGTPDISTDNFHLLTTGCPAGQTLLFFYGAGQTSQPFGNGLLCVSGASSGIFRFRPVQIDGSGTATMKVDYTIPPAGVGGGPGMWIPGDTWYCQGWYRDPAGGGSYFNLSNGLSVQVCATSGVYDEMLLIPAGTFAMGRHAGSADPDELPVHAVTLDAFHMDIFEVSNQKYADYLNVAYGQGLIEVSGGFVFKLGGGSELLCETAALNPHCHITWDQTTSTFGVIPGWEERPIVQLTWYGSCTYANQQRRNQSLLPCYDEATWTCDFSASGYRLPTEAEWEYAARGGQHSPYTVYPWGATLDGSQANFQGSGDPYETGLFPWTTPVGYYDGYQVPAGVDMANGYGLYDMAGNVFEWCWDWYDDSYYSTSSSSNPRGPSSGSKRVWRGGAWLHSSTNLRSANRDEGEIPGFRLRHLGFRVVAR